MDITAAVGRIERASQSIEISFIPFLSMMMMIGSSRAIQADDATVIAIKSVHNRPETRYGIVPPEEI